MWVPVQNIRELHFLRSLVAYNVLEDIQEMGKTGYVDIWNRFI